MPRQSPAPFRLSRFATERKWLDTTTISAWRTEWAAHRRRGRAMTNILFVASTIAAKPILRFVEPVSLRPVTLVGTMHYNPRSVSLVRSIIAEAAPLGAVCVELCDARWNADCGKSAVSESSEQGVVAVVGMVHLNGVRRRLLRVATPPSMSIREEPLEPPTILPITLQRRWRRTFGCASCADTRAVSCPNCDGKGGYVAMGGVPVVCKACRGTGRVVCRDCFIGDGNDIEAIRRDMGVPD